MNESHAIVKQYMDAEYPGINYTMRQGDGAVWVTKGSVDIYFIIRDNRIVGTWTGSGLTARG